MAAAGLTAADYLVEGGDLDTVGLAFDFIERMILLGSVALLATLVLRVTSLETRTDDIDESLARARRESSAWRAGSRELLRDLSSTIDRQFADWGLTEAEADIAALMLKGVSTRDIGHLRRTSAATIRQQAQGIYRKSGLRNRVELSAYFLEDLFSVVEDGPRPEGDVALFPGRR